MHWGQWQGSETNGDHSVICKADKPDARADKRRETIRNQL